MAVVVVFGIGYSLKGKTTATAEVVHLRTVTVAKISDLVNDATPLPLIGEVQSANEATIRSESSGPITHLYHKLGDYVSAGTIIAEIENSSQRAALLQAQGVLESAQAGVDKSGKLYGEAQRSALNTIRNVYTSNDDVVRTKLDVLFRNPTSDLPVFLLLTSNTGLVTKIQNTRVAMRAMLADESARSAQLSETTDIVAEIALATQDTQTLKQYVDDMALLLNAAIASNQYSQTTIDGFVAIASAQRGIVNGSVASLAGASQALVAAQTSGTVEGGASASDAAIKTAQGAHDAAAASLEKTIIRAPIAGTLNNMSLKLGDFVNAFQQVAVVSNNGTLEIIAHISPEDRAQLAVGNAVRIEHEYTGTIASIAPAIDPATRKIEVKINFNGTIAGLTNGQSVHLDLTRTPKKVAAKNAPLAIPISAVKIQADNSVVFSVDEKNHLVAHPVVTGALIGDKIEIRSTTTPATMEIVTDARGLKDGQEVTIQ